MPSSSYLLQVNRKLTEERLKVLLVNLKDHTLNINPSAIIVPPHIETSQFICNANKLTCFYMRETMVVNGLRACVTKISFYYFID